MPGRASNCSVWPSPPRSRFFAGRQQLYERYYSGDPVRLAGTLYGLYDRDCRIERIFGMLDALEARTACDWGLCAIRLWGGAPAYRRSGRAASEFEVLDIDPMCSYCVIVAPAG
jgi:hypothetical protein